MPVIVLSHGLGGSREGYAPLVAGWTQAGFLVIQPTHSDSRALRPDRDPMAWRTGDGRGRPRRREDDRVPAIEAWDERPGDVVAVLDGLDALFSAAGVDPATVDADNIGVAGHSFGAQTALWMSGVPAWDAAGIERRFGDPRVDAVVLLSPQGLGGPLRREALAEVRTPLLMVTGTDDVSPTNGLGPDWRRTTWTALPAGGPRWLLWLDGARHDLGGITGRGTPDPALFDAVLTTTVAFWRRAFADADADAGRARLEAR
jgi:predicted alpha/beta-hydrolase family hydrolase